MYLQKKRPFVLFTSKKKISLMKYVSVALIKAYQKYISPYKGYSCAYRILYGGESCSEYVKNTILQQGTLEALILSRQRFNRCQEANIILNSRLMSATHKNCNEPQDFCIPEPIQGCLCSPSCCQSGDGNIYNNIQQKKNKPKNPRKK